eukprot:895089-Pyramimonas_sp.AAC.1
MRGNDAAGLAAKQVAALCPRPAPDELGENSRLASTARKFDSPDAPRVRRSELEAKEASKSDAHWLWCRTFWRCQTRLQFKRQQACPRVAGCSGKLPPAALGSMSVDAEWLAFSVPVALPCIRALGAMAARAAASSRSSAIASPRPKVR